MTALSALHNGNYVVSSGNWDNGDIIDAGAVVLGDGTLGARGVISAGRALVGAKQNDSVGSPGVVPLIGSASGFVVVSRNWSAPGQNPGAITWHPGVGVLAGNISPENSLTEVAMDLGDAHDIASAQSDGSYVVCGSAPSSALPMTWSRLRASVTGTFATAHSFSGAWAG